MNLQEIEGLFNERESERIIIRNANDKITEIEQKKKKLAFSGEFNPDIVSLSLSNITKEIYAISIAKWKELIALSEQRIEQIESKFN